MVTGERVAWRRGDDRQRDVELRRDFLPPAWQSAADTGRRSKHRHAIEPIVAPHVHTRYKNTLKYV